MKRSSSVKKLALSRETLRRLSDQTLREAAGGGAPQYRRHLLPVVGM